MLVCKINFVYQELIACILNYFQGHDHGNVCVMPCAGCIIDRAQYAHAIWIINVPHTQADALVSQSTVYNALCINILQMLEVEDNSAMSLCMLLP